MELDKIMSLTGSECEVRLSEIKAEMNADGANIEALSAEVDAIQKRMDMLAA